MAEGIRIEPRPGLNWPGDRSVCVTDHSRPKPPPSDGSRLEDVTPMCGFCGRKHFAKTYVIHLHRGAAIVSPVVWSRLQDLDDNPFVYSNPVPEPPGQRLGLTAPGARSLPSGGVRIRWAAEQPLPAEAVVCLTDPARPFRPPTDGTPLRDVIPICRACGKQHLAKTYQIQTECGEAVVSREAWDNMARIPGNPFVTVGDVPHPSPLIIAPTAPAAARPELIEKFVMPLPPPPIPASIARSN